VADLVVVKMMVMVHLVVDPVVVADGEHGQEEHFLIHQAQTLIMVLVLLLLLQMENLVFKVMLVDME
tara:strand:- start:126 stop:326 length:201 start_codon:yes stop_codon:yes gene_type:complete